LTALTGRITDVQVTVVQKPNQGTIRQRGWNPLSGSFFGSFWRSKKEQENRKQLFYVLLSKKGLFFS